MTPGFLAPMAPVAGGSIELARAMFDALRARRLDEAEALLDELSEARGLPRTDPSMLVFHVTLAIQRGRAHDALLDLNNMGEQTSPELRAVCMHLTGDPQWHGLATAIEQSTTNENVRLAMQHLLSHEPEAA